MTVAELRIELAKIDKKFDNTHINLDGRIDGPDGDIDFYEGEVKAVTVDSRKGVVLELFIRAF